MIEPRTLRHRSVQPCGPSDAGQFWPVVVESRWQIATAVHVSGKQSIEFHQVSFHLPRGHEEKEIVVEAVHGFPLHVIHMPKCATWPM